jgi:hypothetical protein
MDQKEVLKNYKEVFDALIPAAAAKRKFKKEKTKISTKVKDYLILFGLN